MEHVILPFLLGHIFVVPSWFRWIFQLSWVLTARMGISMVTFSCFWLGILQSVLLICFLPLQIWIPCHRCTSHHFLLRSGLVYLPLAFILPRLCHRHHHNPHFCHVHHQFPPQVVVIFSLAIGQCGVSKSCSGGVPTSYRDLYRHRFRHSYHYNLF